MDKSLLDHNALRVTIYLVKRSSDLLEYTRYGKIYRRALNNIDASFAGGYSSEDAASLRKKLDELNANIILKLCQKISTRWLTSDEEALTVRTVVNALNDALELGNKLASLDPEEESSADINALFAEVLGAHEAVAGSTNLFTSGQIAALTNRGTEMLDIRLPTSSEDTKRYLAEINGIRGTIEHFGRVLGSGELGVAYRDAIRDSAKGLVEAPLEHVLKQERRLQQLEREAIQQVEQTLMPSVLDLRQQTMIIELCGASMTSAMVRGQMLEELNWEQVGLARAQLEDRQADLAQLEQQVAQLQAAIAEANADIVSLEAQISELFNRPPRLEDASLDVPENSPQGTTIGRVVAQDLDLGDRVSYEFTKGNGAGVFAIDADRGIVTLEKAVLNHETAASHELTVQVTDSREQSASATLTINVTNVDEGPVFRAYRWRQQLYNAPVGTWVADFSAQDPDGGAVTYSIVAGEHRELFEIDPSSGIVRVKRNPRLSIETTLTVQVSDAGGNTQTRDFPVKIIR